MGSKSKKFSRHEISVQKYWRFRPVWQHLANSIDSANVFQKQLFKILRLKHGFM